MSDSAKLEAAAMRAKSARAQLRDTAQELQVRLDPATLLDEAVVGVKSGASDLAGTVAEAARRRPGIVAGGIAVALFVLVRRPFRRRGGRRIGLPRDT